MGKKKTDSAGRAPDHAPPSPEAVVEARLAIVRELTLQGHGSGEELVIGLAKLGHKISKETAGKYSRIIRDRMRSDARELQEMRREWLRSTLVSMDNRIAKLLKDFKVKPTWRDRIDLIKLANEVIEKEIPMVGPAHPEDAGDLAGADPKELEALLEELATNAGIVLAPAEVPVDEELAS